MINQNKYYKILNIDNNSSLDDIKKQYRKLVLIYHPDKNKNSHISSEKMKEINTAYDELVKSKKYNDFNYFDYTTCDINFKDVFNYMLLYLINKPQDIKLNVHVDLIDIYNEHIKKISYKIQRGDKHSIEYIYIELCNYEDEYIFSNMGDENIFTKERSDVIVKVFVDNNKPNLSINFALNRYELIYLMKINLYEYFYGVYRNIDLLGETININEENLIDRQSILLKYKGLPHYDDNDNKIRGDLIIFVEVDVSYNKIENTRNDLLVKSNIKEYFDILKNEYKYQKYNR